MRVGNLAGLWGVLNYIKADFKTKDGALVFGKDCFPEKAFEQMAITKKAFNKDIGRQYMYGKFQQSRNKDKFIRETEGAESNVMLHETAKR